MKKGMLRISFFVMLAATILPMVGQAASADYYDTVQKCYIGYYQRPADPGGLLWWAERLNEVNGDLSSIINAFATSDESRALYGEVNNNTISDVVDGIYMGLLSRTASQIENDYWSGLFKDGKISAAAIMLIMLNGAQNEDLVTINNKLAAANLFTRAIDPELDGADFQVTYSGNSDATAGRDFLTSVNYSSQTRPNQDVTMRYVRANISDGGDVLSPSALLHDDFDGSIVWASNWHIPTWVSPTDGTYVGQTQFRCTPASLPAIADGNAIIALDTYNPTAIIPGDSFYGTDLISNQSFAHGEGITFMVRAKINNPFPAGLVFGIFLYSPPDGSDKPHDEIDFEILGNDPTRVYTNIYGNEPLGVGHPASHLYMTGPATDYHTYRIDWLPGQVSWYVDGQLIRTVTTESPIPLGPMYVHLNAWVPKNDFAVAYGMDCKTYCSASPGANQTFSISIDRISVW